MGEMLSFPRNLKSHARATEGWYVNLFDQTMSLVIRSIGVQNIFRYVQVGVASSLLFPSW